MDFWIKEIIEQIGVGITLKESKLDSGNRLSLIIIDNAVEYALKFYASYNSLLKEKEINSNEGFFLVLQKIDGKKITNKTSKEIKHFHKIRNGLYHGGKPTTVGDKIIDEYVKNTKDLLKGIFNFQMAQVQWTRLIQDQRKNISKHEASIKEPVSFNAEEIEGNNLVRITTTAKLMNTESIMLVIHGYTVTRARTPDTDELKRSLMLSGRDIPENVLSARLSDLRRTGYVERKSLKLKGKALTQLRKKFSI